MKREFETTQVASDPMVAAVASLLYHENTNDQRETPKMHLEALQHIVAARGGLEGFSVDSRLLVQKICR